MTDNFTDFQAAFFQLFEQPQFGGQTFLQYLEKADRSGDEASVVDNAISGPLLTALGYSSGEQTYNAVKSDLSRPDFEPKIPEIGVCFVVEDKGTVEELNAKWRAQLAGYVRGAGVALGLLGNGSELQLWEFGAKTERQILRVDVVALLELRAAKKTADKSLDEIQLRPLESLFDLLRREAFTDATKIAAELAVDADKWRQNAKKLGANSEAEAELVADLRGLVAQLQRDARRQLDAHLDDVAALKEQLKWADDKAEQTAQHAIFEGRALVENSLNLTGFASKEAIIELAALYAQDPRSLPSRDFFVARALEIHNQSAPKALKTLGDNINGALEKYAETVLTIHARRTRLNQRARADLAVQADFDQWKDLVSETMLGDLSNVTAAEADDAQRAEFALQAAYVVFIRLLLIRVCEDKGIFPDRFLSNGGLLHWQDDIKRYLRFVRGNRYEPLLKMAYDNAANIYAHFFTGRELFNWYHLGETALLEALKRLAKYDFADVDSDLLGTVYNAYVERHEKKKQGQYYTPRPIVDFILDEVKWQGKSEIIGDQKRLIDPACGSGTFLVRAAKRLMDAYRNEKGEISDPRAVLSKVRDKIYGFDLNPFACYLAEVNLLIQVLDAVRALPDSERMSGLERFHVYNVDALAKAGRGVLALGHDSLLAEELDVVERIKGRQDKYANGFSHVVANPPYGARLSADYKSGLKRDYPAVFRGQPDTYVFFYALGLELLASSGRLGFISPNTFLMGTNTDVLRGALLGSGQIERIVDLPQGLWDDATVDCVLLFLRKAHRIPQAIAIGNSKAKWTPIAPEEEFGEVEVNLMELSDDLDKLRARAWAETLTQSQSAWQADPAHAMDIRRDAIQEAIEAACIVQKKMNQTEFAPEVLRLGDIVDSSMGIKPFEHEHERVGTSYIRSKRDVPDDDDSWKPFLDGDAFVGRYELRWSPTKMHIKYGNHLSRAREARYFDSPKILIVRFRNRSLYRRLVGQYDEMGFYNRDNYSDIILEDKNYNLKYILAIFNSRLLNYWYKNKFLAVTVTPDYFQQIPIFPADAAMQAEIVALVDELLNVHRELNAWRERGYRIELGKGKLSLPFDALLAELQSAQSDLETLDLRDARAVELFSIAAECDANATLGSPKIDKKFPTQITLKFRKLWLDVPDVAVREFLLNLLSRPQFAGRKWSELESDDSIRVPADAGALERFFDYALNREAEIRAQWSRAETLDRQIDERVLDLYGINDASWRAKIMDSAPESEDETDAA